MSVYEWLANAWGVLFAVATLVAAIVASAHAVLYKRDTRATVLWVGFIWLAPLVGAICYLLLGINRIKRKARLLRVGQSPRAPASAFTWEPEGGEPSPVPPMAHDGANLRWRIRLVDRVTDLRLLPGNRATPLFNGDHAYPEMLAAIDAAERSVALSTYIFDRDKVGLEFVDALGRAVRRGVEVRVLVDATGARYSLPTIIRPLRRAGVTCARFLPTLNPFKAMSFNLRNHRKLLIVDGRVAFTGGMNIRSGHRTDETGKLSVRDCHFKVEGPVVAQLRDVFADDWLFTTNEELDGPEWTGETAEVGDYFARCINDGPDIPLDRIRWVLLGGLATALERVCIATPYFLPDPQMISGLNTASLRGASVEILLPEKNNLPYVQWACQAHLWQVLERGCRVFVHPGPFDHTKVMVVDGKWTMFGSSNWDPRSLRLNFECDVECYGEDLARRMTSWFDERVAAGREVTLAEVDGRSLPIKLRDGIARLATPFL